MIPKIIYLIVCFSAILQVFAHKNPEGASSPFVKKQDGTIAVYYYLNMDGIISPAYKILLDRNGEKQLSNPLPFTPFVSDKMSYQTGCCLMASLGAFSFYEHFGHVVETRDEDNIYIIPMFFPVDKVFHYYRASAIDIQYKSYTNEGIIKTIPFGKYDKIDFNKHDVPVATEIFDVFSAAHIGKNLGILFNKKNINENFPSLFVSLLNINTNVFEKTYEIRSPYNEKDMRLVRVSKLISDNHSFLYLVWIKYDEKQVAENNCDLVLSRIDTEAGTLNHTTLFRIPPKSELDAEITPDGQEIFIAISEVMVDKDIPFKGERANETMDITYTMPDGKKVTKTEPVLSGRLQYNMMHFFLYSIPDGKTIEIK